MITYTIPTRRNYRKGVNTLDRTVFQKSRSGAECIYIRVTKTTGVKIFACREDAEYSISRQRKAHKIGIGPEVLSPVHKCGIKGLPEFEDYTKAFAYFYITEVASGVGKRVTDEVVYRLEDMLESIGLGQNDLHEDNIGRINGKPVVIDFGPASR